MTTKTTKRINITATLTHLVRFERVNTHIPGNPVEYFGAVWFLDGHGTRFVSFVRKTTKLWQAVRVAKKNARFTFAGNVKEHRVDDEHGDRWVLTHIRLTS